jgi:hypothetical protein
MHLFKRIGWLAALAVMLTLVALLDMGGRAAAESGAQIVFSDEADNVIANAVVRVLCFAGPDAAPFADRLLTTDAGGRATLPRGCAYVAALREIYAQPAGKPEHGPAYRIYATSWRADNPRPSATSEVVAIRADQPLTLFNVVASLDWQPAPDNPFVQELRAGLLAASGYLFDVSEGQMAFGELTLHTNGRSWQGADLRFLRANDYRPTAYVGGIVPEPIQYGPASGTIYKPGATYYGRYWDGNDAFRGPWDGPDGYRTIVHEWAHYALFLYDEYINSAGGIAQCTDAGVKTPLDEAEVAKNASIMYYQYTTSEFWSKNAHGLPANCLDTVQFEVHGEPDWQTLEKWHLIQQLPVGFVRPPLLEPPALTPCDTDPVACLGLAAYLFDATPGYGAYLPAVRRPGAPPPTDLSEPRVEIALADGLREAETAPAQVYWLEGGRGERPQRILHEGAPFESPPSGNVLGKMTLLGVQRNGRVYAEAARYAAGETRGLRYVYPRYGEIPPTPTDGDTLTLEVDRWAVTLDPQYVVTDGDITQMVVNLESIDPALRRAPIAQLCIPDSALGCFWEAEMTPVGGGGALWSTTFDFTGARAWPSQKMPLYAVLRVEAPNVGEIVRWVQASGGVGPAHQEADAPLRDGPLLVDTSAAIDNTKCNQVVVMPAANHEALQRPLPFDPNAPGGLIGVPLDVEILLGERRDGRCEDRFTFVPVTFTLFYSQDLIDQLGIDEGQLRLLHYFPENRAWSEDLTAAIDTDLNWISSIPLNEGGIYAIGWAP